MICPLNALLGQTGKRLKDEFQAQHFNKVDAKFVSEKPFE